MAEVVAVSNGNGLSVGGAEKTPGRKAGPGAEHGANGPGKKKASEPATGHVPQRSQVIKFSDIIEMTREELNMRDIDDEY